LKIPGEVNVYNALAASAVGLMMNVSYKNIKDALENFAAEEKRFEIIFDKGITIINDCYNANPNSMQMAIQLLKNFNYNSVAKRIAVLGDMLELGDFSVEEHKKIGEHVFNSNIDYSFTFGTYAGYISNQAKALGMENVEHFGKKEKIAERLKSILTDDSILLLKGSRGMQMETILDLFSLKRK